MRITCMIRSLTLGGAERQLTGLAVMLKDNGHDVEVLTYHEADFYAQTLQEAGVRHTFIAKDGSSARLERRIAEHFREWQPDAVIAFLTGPCVKACHVHKLYPHFRLIVSERNVNTWTGPHDLWRMLVFREADLVVTNSHAQESYLRRRFPFIAAKLRTIVNFVDTDAFMPATGEVSGARLRPLIVTTARVDSRKNVHGYIRALALLRDEGLSFYAKWYGLKKEDAYYRRCQRLIRRFGLEDRFEILPATIDVVSVYRNADCFCLPSFYEGTPNSLCEALSCGLPAVATLVSDNASYVCDGLNGFTCSTHPADIAAALRQLLTALQPGHAAGTDAGSEDGTDAGLHIAAMRKASRDIAISRLSKPVFISAWLSVI